MSIKSHEKKNLPKNKVYSYTQMHTLKPTLGAGKNSNLGSMCLPGSSGLGFLKSVTLGAYSAPTSPTIRVPKQHYSCSCIREAERKDVPDEPQPTLEMEVRGCVFKLVPIATACVPSSHPLLRRLREESSSPGRFTLSRVLGIQFTVWVLGSSSQGCC